MSNSSTGKRSVWKNLWFVVRAVFSVSLTITCAHYIFAAWWKHTSSWWVGVVALVVFVSFHTVSFIRSERRFTEYRRVKAEHERLTAELQKLRGNQS